MARTTLLPRFLGVALTAAALPAPAQQLDFTVDTEDKSVTSALQGASLLYAGQDQADRDPRDVLAAARADYSRLVNALYGQGYYGGTVKILVDGREAAALSPFAAPDRIGTVTVEVDAGPQFTFGDVSIGPRAPGSTAPDAFQPGAPGDELPGRVLMLGVFVDAGAREGAEAGTGGHAFHQGNQCLPV